MELTIVVCTVLSTIWLVKPWRCWPWFKRLWWRLRHRAEYRGEFIDYKADQHDPLEQFRRSGASAATFKTDRLYP